ncbi:MAG TPA: hypothetical protein VKG44_11670, partial [Candidatus Baltobacteraceae bacterium]|nr:hypothetical protein [Candidatus Baltobacteraceae bacterium]
MSALPRYSLLVGPLILRSNFDVTRRAIIRERYQHALRAARALAHPAVLFGFGIAAAFAGCSGANAVPSVTAGAMSTPATTPTAVGATPTPAKSTTPTPVGATPTPHGTATPTAIGATPTPAPTATTSGSSFPLSYNSATACINHVSFTNNVLPSNEGEFATNGLDRSFWGGTKTRTYSPAATWGPGFFPSWGRHQYDTYMGDSSDGTGYDPFSIVTDSGASGSPKALRIEAMPVPAPIATSLTVLANDQWPVTSASSSFTVPSEGGTLTVNVNNPNGAQTNWKVGIGYQNAPIMFVGTLSSGGSTPSGNGTGGSNPWTISHIHIYAGSAGTTITPGSVGNDEGGLRAYNFPQYYSGTLDANVNQQYGFFVARVRLPQPLPALSPAWWMLETGGVGTNAGKLLRSEWDVEEQFAAVYNYELNAGNILWNSGTPTI